MSLYYSKSSGRCRWTSGSCCFMIIILFIYITWCLIIDMADSTPICNPKLKQYENCDLSPTVTNNNGKILRLVHLVFRHGPRTPADTYPTDPHLNETFYPYGWGHLTNDGKKSLFETGEWLRHRYGKYLDELYLPDQVWAQTTGVTRTQMSMATVLAGLYPPKDTALEWNRRLNWQPIPIFSEPLEQDTLLLVRTPCPRYYEALEEVFQTDEIQKLLANNKELFEELTKITGMTVKSPDDIQSLYSTLRAEDEYRLKLPEWTKSYYPDRLLPLTELSYMLNVYTDELKKFKAGPFLKKMITEWQEKRNNTIKPKDRKIFLYTGHDSTIVNIMAALNVWEQQLPVYGIMGIFELVEDIETGVWGVQIYLRNYMKNGGQAVPLKLPGCEHFCPLEKFIELTQKLIIIDPKTECSANNINFTTPPPSGP